MPPLNQATTIIHAQRADQNGNAQLWGLIGVQKETAFAARNVIVVAEEIVEERIIRPDPNRTLIPGLIVSAVVKEPFGCHPSYAQGYYDRDNEFYVRWREISRDLSQFRSYLDEWVYGVADRAEYVERSGERLERLRAREQFCEPVNYGY